MTAVLFAEPKTRGPHVAREQQWFGKHPDPMPGVGVLVVDPMAYPIQRGDATLNWEGDDRLALYADIPGLRWVLVRLEHDGVYRMVASRRMTEVRGPELVVSLINRLVEHDVRRGVDVHLKVIAENEKVEAAIAAHCDDRMTANNERLRWALHKDGLDNHCTGL